LGSGNKRRNNKARIAAIAADPEAASALLQQAAARSRTDPQAAFDRLYPNNRTAVSDLGPAFFTKYLYFAGGGDPPTRAASSTRTSPWPCRRPAVGHRCR